jgi:hypothetical protein
VTARTPFALKLFLFCGKDLGEPPDNSGDQLIGFLD